MSGGQPNERARTRANARWVASLVACACIEVSTTRAAHADVPSPSAEQLFQESRALVAKGDYAAACPKLEASQNLDPAVGTQFNLADCYEHVGRTATAFALFEEVARIARAAGKFERERSARERAAALAPKLARVHLDVIATAAGLEVRLDDQPLARSAWSEPFPVDPGAHRIVASAPSHAPWDVTIAAEESKLVEVRVPELVDTTVRAPAARAPVVVATSSTQKTVAFVAGGIGIAGLAVGAASGIVAVTKRSSAQRECPSEVFAYRCPTESGATAWNAATTAGDVSTISFIVGGALVAGAAVLWLTAPPARTQVGMSLSGVRLEGRF